MTLWGCVLLYCCQVIINVSVLSIQFLCSIIRTWSKHNAVTRANVFIPTVKQSDLNVIFAISTTVKLDLHSIVGVPCQYARTPYHLVLYL